MEPAHTTLSFQSGTPDGMGSDGGTTFTSRADGCVINVRELHEVSAWTSCLGCSEERLRLAIAAVGPDLEEVCNHLGTVPPAEPLNVIAGNSTSH